MASSALTHHESPTSIAEWKASGWTPVAPPKTASRALGENGVILSAAKLAFFARENPRQSRPSTPCRPSAGGPSSSTRRRRTRRRRLRSGPACSRGSKTSTCSHARLLAAAAAQRDATSSKKPTEAASPPSNKKSQAAIDKLLGDLPTPETSKASKVPRKTKEFKAELHAAKHMQGEKRGQRTGKVFYKILCEFSENQALSAFQSGWHLS